MRRSSWRAACLFTVMTAACASTLGDGQHLDAHVADDAGRDPGRELDDGATDAAAREQGSGYQPREVPGYRTGDCTVDVRRSRRADIAAQTPLGFSGDAVLDQFNKGAIGAFTWADGSRTRILMQVSTEQTSIRYDDSPRDQRFCPPTLTISPVRLEVRTEDGLLDTEIEVGINGDPVGLVAGADGEGGIQVIFLSNASLDPARIAYAGVAEAVAARPDNDTRAVSIELGLSFFGVRPYCVKGETVHDAADEPCNRYHGVLRFRSRPHDLFEDPHRVDESQLFSTALGYWYWQTDPA